MPIIVNLTILNGMDVVGEIVGQVDRPRAREEMQ
jgi:hypothetical protein